jgi:hypothetical protein
MFKYVQYPRRTIQTLSRLDELSDKNNLPCEFCLNLQVITSPQIKDDKGSLRTFYLPLNFW